jgi:DNA-binding PadR family transcriptional regulator
MPRPAAPIATDHIILALLQEGPMHGYEIHQRISSMPGIVKIWNIKQGLLYAKLEKLKELGLLEDAPDHPEANPTRHYFRLTPAGSDAINAWIDSPVMRARDIRQEFLAKLIAAHKVSQERALTLLRAQREVCRHWYTSLAEQTAPKEGSDLDDWIVHSYRLFRDEASLRWLDDLEKWLIKLG